MNGSWRTTALGVCLILVAIASAGKALLDGDPATVVNIQATLAEVLAGWALIMARDDKVSSEEAGAK